MAFFRPRVSREAEVRYHADQEIARNLTAVLDEAREAERRLREVRAAATSPVELREAELAFERALTRALRTAEAAQRAAFGVRAYDDRIARRKAKATPVGAGATAEVNRLRTLREAHKLRVTRVPSASAACG